jgi:hypothetical protein
MRLLVRLNNAIIAVRPMPALAFTLLSVFSHLSTIGDAFKIESISLCDHDTINAPRLRVARALFASGALPVEWVAGFVEVASWVEKVRLLPASNNEMGLTS